MDLDPVARHILTLTADGIVVLNAQGIIQYANTTALAMFDAAAADISGGLLETLIPPQIAREQCRAIAEYATLLAPAGTPALRQNRTFAIPRASGVMLHVEMRTFELPPQTGDRSFALLISDITRWKTLELEKQELVAKTTELALTDELTGLPNRRAFDAHFIKQISMQARRDTPLSLGIVDIEHLSRINDEHGRAIGDRVLKSVALILNSGLRDADYLARFGDDEFAILLPETDAVAATAVFERLQQVLCKTPINADKGSILIGVTISLVDCQSNLNSLKLVVKADRALYAAKTSGAGKVIGV